ncbi:MAG: hypothetical protein JNL98_27575 [Bryobacterales bacterium]|nr:hypothetical protein [Bryobacterales bacterium]
MWYQSIVDRLNSGQSPAAPGSVEEQHAVPHPRRNIAYPPDVWRHLCTEPVLPTRVAATDPQDWQTADVSSIQWCFENPPAPSSIPGAISGSPPSFDPLDGQPAPPGQDEFASAGSTRDASEGGHPGADPGESPKIHPKVLRMVHPDRPGLRPAWHGEYRSGVLTEMPHPSGHDPFEFDEMPGVQTGNAPPAHTFPGGAHAPKPAPVHQAAANAPMEWEMSAELPYAWPIDQVADRGYFPYVFPPKLTPVDIHGAHFYSSVAFKTEPVKDFWWKQPGPAKASKSKSRGNPSIVPKGFTGFQPITKSQPSFRTLRLRTGDYAMAETVSRERAQAITAPTIGVASTNLQAVKQTALRLSEKHWGEFQFPLEPVDLLDYPQTVEFAGSTSLWFPASGFDFQSDPELHVNGFKRFTDESPLVKVADVLVEPESPAPSRTTTFEPLIWDEIDSPADINLNGIPALAAALELYEPPAPAAKEATPQPAEATIPDPPAAKAPPEPEAQPPEMRDVVKFPAPHLRNVESAGHANEPASAAGSRIHLPALTVQPLRPPMSLGPLPESMTKPEGGVKADASAPAQGSKSDHKTGEIAQLPRVDVPRVDVPRVEVSRVETQPQTPAEDKPATREPAKAEAQADSKQAPASAKPAQQETRSSGKGRNRRRRENADDPIEEPMGLSEELEDALAQAAGHSGSADDEVATEHEKPELPKPDSKRAEPKKAEVKLDVSPVVESSTKSFLLNPEPAPAPASETLSIGLNPGSASAEPASSGNGMKIGIIAAVLAVVGGVAVWQFSGSSSTTAKPAAKGAQARGANVEVGGSVIGEPGWSQDWTLDASGNRLRQIAFYRPSMTVIDYRVEFLAEIESKAVAWVTRAANVRNYYLIKLVQIKGGAEPQVNLVRFAVRDGKADVVAEKPLPFPVRMGEVYRVRMDVLADRFTVNVQDKVVDEWVDAKLLTGGFGVASEAPERGQIRSIQMWHLKPRSK